MVLAIVSVFALAVTWGPQLHVNLQAELDEEISPVSERIEVTPEAETLVEEGPDDAISENEDRAEQASTAQPDAIVNATTAAETSVETQRSGEVAPAEWPGILDAASAALAAAQTATGDFVQTNPDGTVVTGRFALNRPGRMRFDYDEPTPILIVSDGTTVAMEDSELETVDRVPIGSTPLGLILSTQLNVEDDVEVLGVFQNVERVGIRVSDASGELQGTLTMVFNRADYALVGWLAVDGNLQSTVVDLMDVQTNERLDPRLFRLDEDDEEEDER